MVQTKEKRNGSSSQIPVNCSPPVANGLPVPYSYVESHHAWAQRPGSSFSINGPEVFDCPACGAVLVVHRRGPSREFVKARLEMPASAQMGGTDVSIVYKTLYWRYVQGTFSGARSGILPTTAEDYLESTTGERQSGRRKRGRK